MRSSRRIVVNEESQVGEVRRYISDLCQTLSGDKTVVGRASIVATEMARNIVLHGKGGEFVVRESSTSDRTSIDLLAIDRGPGIGNIGEALRDGYSTAGTAGNGLGSIKRMADAFDLYSLPTGGTVIWAKINLRPPDTPAPSFICGGINIALEGHEVCGDAWAIQEQNGFLRLLVVDGLGHGELAADAAREAVDTFRRHQGEPPGSTLEITHQALMKTRGAAAAIVEMHPGRSQIKTAGVGNISMRLIDTHSGSTKSYICENGTLGANTRRVLEFVHPLPPESLLIVHTDGLGTQWNLAAYPGLMQRQPEVVAAVLYRDFTRGRDDVTVVVARHSK